MTFSNVSETKCEVFGNRNIGVSSPYVVIPIYVDVGVSSIQCKIKLQREGSQ